MPPTLMLLILFATAVLVVALVGVSSATLRRLLGGERRPEGARVAGTLARVTTTIPADGVGAVTFVREGRRVSRAAKSLCRDALGEGAQVLVVSTDGGALVVDGLSPDMKEMFR